MKDDSVTKWVGGVKCGDEEATRKFVDRYYEPIVEFVRRRLPPAARRSGDEEDVALSALDSFVERARDGQFSQVENRDDLWKLLLTISRRKATKHIAHETAQKRGGGLVRGDSVFDAADGSLAGFDRVTGDVASPEEEIELRECVEQIVGFLENLEDQALKEIIILKSQGMTDQELARHFDCSTKTIERKRRRLSEKARKWAEQTT